MNWIKLHRQMLEWEWIKSADHLSLFVQILLSASYKEHTVMGKKIGIGEFYSSLESLSTKSGLSVRRVRTVLKDLEQTGEITKESIFLGKKKLLIKVLNWNSFQVEKYVSHQLSHTLSQPFEKNNAQDIDCYEVSEDANKISHDVTVTPFVTSPVIYSVTSIKGFKQEGKELNNKTYIPELSPSANIGDACHLKKEKIPPKSKISPEQFNQIKNIVDYLNEKAGTNFRSQTEHTQKFILRRFADNFSLFDFFKVIDLKILEWKHDPVNSKYLRPETLFGNKFEGYLQSANKNLVQSTRMDPETQVRERLKLWNKLKQKREEEELNGKSIEI